jgi:hypothetical protein
MRLIDTRATGEELAMRSPIDQFVTLLALLMMPFIGLSAAAHEAEDGSSGESALIAIASVIIIVQLARMLWHGHRERRLHRGR